MSCFFCKENGLNITKAFKWKVSLANGQHFFTVLVPIGSGSGVDMSIGGGCRDFCSDSLLLKLRGDSYE